MGLSLEVGILADLHRHDPEGAAHIQEEFRLLNEYLSSVGLPQHQEPHTCDVWSADLMGYSALHSLRRVAAYLDSSGELPDPSDGSSTEDRRVHAYYEQATGSSPSLFARLFRKRETFKRHFDHLMVHSDAEGYYLPHDFEKVLVLPQDYEIGGGMLGSVPRLLAECERLATALDIPTQLTPDSDELWAAVDTQGQGPNLWQIYAVASHTCVVLAEGCRRSLATGAALAFR